LTIRRTYDSGQRCKSVFEIISSEGKAIVLKVGETAVGAEEILKNCAGYASIRELGLGELIPHIEESSINEGNAFILMEHCGIDFATAATDHAEPNKMYLYLLTCLREIYQKSLAIRPEDSARTVQVAKERVTLLYDRYLRMHLDTDGTHNCLIRELPKVIVGVSDFSCFAS
jgi:hypothetical protein